MDEINLRKFIGSQIRQFREEKKLSQSDVASYFDTTRQTISRYETGERAANQDILFGLSSLFNKPIDDFFPKREFQIEEEPNMVTDALLDDLTEEEIEEVTAFIEFVKSKCK